MSGLIQGADKCVCLSPASKVFLSVICTIEAWEKKTNNPESEKALQKTRKLRGHSIQRQVHCWQSDRGLWSLAHHCPAAAATGHLLLSSVGPGSPGTAFPPPLLLLLPTEGRGRGDTCSWLRGDIRRGASL